MSNRKSLTLILIIAVTFSVRSQRYYSLDKALANPNDVEYLYLGEQNLDKFPIELLKLKNLKSLNFFKNRITSIPKWISKIECLEELNLSGNPITFIHPNIRKLNELKVLILNNSRFTEIPSTIFKLTTLTKLSLAHTQISEIPDQISRLKNLKSMNFEFTIISSISTNLKKLENLEEIWISEFGSEIDTVPSILFEIPNLKRLFMNGCTAKFLPKKINENRSIEEIRLEYSFLIVVSDIFEQLPNLKVIDFSEPETTIKSFPESLFSMKNIEKILLYDMVLTEEFKARILKVYGKDIVKWRDM